jgi:hypothetical protein
VRFNERKHQTLEYLSRRQWTRPPVYAVAVGFYPIDAAYSYLKRLHKWRYLDRGRDVTGRIVYRLGRRGAKWLLWKRGAV